MNKIKKWTNQILNKYGYYNHRLILSDEDIAKMYASTVGELYESTISPSLEKQMFKDLKEVKYFQDYLRETSAKDIQRYFSAENPKQQDVIRGAIARTAYFRSRLTKSGEPTTKIEGIKYERD